ncbi:DUF2844 domain-containing protein [Paraburkholderia dinghuensis]|uniref:DUF2844 domain-containing protein n=1 Tax=Paraburkholderia dinghuensis TaxID=2305225 RepID=A0A3N6NFD0_9BURK|nr:DUF2844 domain-containing protein [Paraburkholderia dinghuensis]RQH07752.1 DUF2844 domain-containing protein [Paraburkholderia dinghuensis]
MTTRKSSRADHLAACACLSVGLWLATPAHAALGDTATPITGATTGTIASGAARVLSYVDAGGTTINEYIAPTNDEIFAYSWEGPTMPNLQTLLGRHYASYRSGAAAALAAQPGNLHNARVNQTGVIVETGGQMRSYVGRAWLPAALPAGVNEGDLR